MNNDYFKYGIGLVMGFAAWFFDAFDKVSALFG